MGNGTYRPGHPGCPVALSITQARLLPVPPEAGLPAGEPEPVAGPELPPESLSTTCFPCHITPAPDVPYPKPKAVTQFRFSGHWSAQGMERVPTQNRIIRSHFFRRKISRLFQFSNQISRLSPTDLRLTGRVALAGWRGCSAVPHTTGSQAWSPVGARVTGRQSMSLSPPPACSLFKVNKHILRLGF